MTTTTVQEKLKDIVQTYLSSPVEYISVNNVLETKLLENFIPVSSGFESLVVDSEDHAVKVLEHIVESFCATNNLKSLLNGNQYFFYSDTDMEGYISHRVQTAKTAQYNYSINAKYKKALAETIVGCPITQQKPILTRISVSGRGYLDANEVLFNAPSLNIPSVTLYPWCYDTPENISNAFMNSSANVLLLYGEPGTGKTTFIKKMLENIGFSKERTINIIDTPEVMASPELMNMIFQSQPKDIFIFEDVDRHLYSRSEGNDIMAGLLNAAEGLASPDVKIIISTNIMKIADIDTALLRPGRCFNNIEFKKLDTVQQNAIREFIGAEALVVDKAESLAEVMNTQVNAGKKFSVGFN